MVGMFQGFTVLSRSYEVLADEILMKALIYWRNIYFLLGYQLSRLESQFLYFQLLLFFERKLLPLMSIQFEKISRFILKDSFVVRMN